MKPYHYDDITQFLKENAYPGRGLILGCSPKDRQAVLAYFIMGRSENSRNRIFVKENHDLFTRPHDNTKVQDPSLIIYRALTQYRNHLVLTNGNHTDTIRQYLEQGQSFEDALRTRSFEPDEPNFTPRISGMVTFDESVPQGFTYTMSILKSLDSIGSYCSRSFFEYPATPGKGHFLHTYAQDGNPLLPFSGEPRPVMIPDDIGQWSDALWDSLDSDNKIALYVRYCDTKTGAFQERIFNKHTISYAC